MGFKFEGLKVWQKAIDLTLEINLLTKKFPSEEKFVLGSQIQRASDSVALNIAEGSTGQSNLEFKRFIGYSLRSAIEVVSCLYIGKKRDVISQQDFEKIYKEYEELIIKPQSLRNKIN